MGKKLGLSRVVGKTGRDLVLPEEKILKKKTLINQITKSSTTTTKP
jgi:hypothetical protein